MPPMKTSRLYLKIYIMAGKTSLLYQEVVYFVKIRVYWFRSVMIFTGPSQKNTFSRVSVLQTKALHFHWFILKVTYFLPSFGWQRMTTILFQDQPPNFFYKNHVNNIFLLIFQLTLIQDSQGILLPQVLTIAT